MNATPAHGLCGVLNARCSQQHQKLERIMADETAKASNDRPVYRDPPNWILQHPKVSAIKVMVETLRLKTKQLTISFLSVLAVSRLHATGCERHSSGARCIPCLHGSHRR